MCQTLNIKQFLPPLGTGFFSGFLWGTELCAMNTGVPAHRGWQCSEKDTKNITQNWMPCSKLCYGGKAREKIWGKIWWGGAFFDDGQENSFRRGTLKQWEQ